MNKNIDYKVFFHNLDIKCTKQRQLILDVLLDLPFPTSAEDIFYKVQLIDNTLNLSTIYRTLELFVAKNVALKSNLSEGKKALYEINHMEHKHYLICVQCKKIISIEYCPLNTFEKTVEVDTGFHVLGHKLEIFGYCPECKSKVIL